MDPTFLVFLVLIGLFLAAAAFILYETFFLSGRVLESKDFSRNAMQPRRRRGEMGLRSVGAPQTVKKEPKRRKTVEIHPRDFITIASPRTGKGFQILRFLNAGAFGNVFLARQLTASPPAYCAIKRLPISRFKITESIILARVNPHPNIIQLIDTIHHPTQVFIVLELAHRTLKEMRALRAFDYNFTRHVALGTARGLQHIHSLKIVHLDLKASNIMLQDGKIKICDFGLASVLPAAAEMKGTWHWMAPETITNRWRSEDFTTGCDVWSFGVLMLEILEGELLFAKKFKSVAEFVEAVREGKFEAPQLSFDGPSWHRKMFGKSVGKMLRLNVEERASAGELVEMFEGMGKVERKRLRRRHFSM